MWEDFPEKNTFSFGHCQNWREPDAQIDFDSFFKVIICLKPLLLSPAQEQVPRQLCCERESLKCKRCLKDVRCPKEYNL